MKGINTITAANDLGQDGITPATGINLNDKFGTDVAAFGLQYFNGDYVAINGQTPMASVNNSSNPASNSSALYNGNIRYMQTRLTNPTTGADMPMLNAYKYDQLNRLKESRSYETGLSSNVWNPTTYGNEYFNAFSYDAMGNILTQVRHKRDGTQIEDMTYQYQYEDPVNHKKLMRNRLYHINDAIGSSVDATDIDDIGVFDSDIEDINVNNNYSYDEEGRLVKDVAEGISKIVWRVDGKVKEIQRVGEDKKWLRFDYDAMGHRIAKHVYDNTGTTLEKSTYYVLDAQGNQVSMYEHEFASETAQYNLVERNIYGSSRLGTFTKSFNLLSYTTNTNNISQVNGYKQYEFTNHLGNVLTVFSDIKIPLDENTDGVVDGHSVCIRNISDYSPFGVSLDGRTIQNDFYRRGFNGMEKDDELKGMGNSYDFGARMYDSRVGRWLTIDPLARKYPDISPYSYVGCNPILFIDPNGEEIRIYYTYKNGDETVETYYVYKSKMKLPDDEYVRETVKTLNKIKRRGMDRYGIINELANDKELLVGIHNTEWYLSGKMIGGDGATKQNEYEDGSLGKVEKVGKKEIEFGVYWNSHSGLLSPDGKKATSAASALLHELGHIFFDLTDPIGYLKKYAEIATSKISNEEKQKLFEELKKDVGEFDQMSDKWIIENVESGFKKEWRRVSHSLGYILKTVGNPFSVKFNPFDYSVKRPGYQEIKKPIDIQNGKTEFKQNLSLPDFSKIKLK